jgi:hypothetical protein
MINVKRVSFCETNYGIDRHEYQKGKINGRVNALEGTDRESNVQKICTAKDGHETVG